MLLQINQLGKSYGGFDIFSDIQFNIPTGRKIGLVGKNGVGKTTLLNMIAGLDTDYHGTISQSSKCKIAYLAQEIQLQEDKTLFEECLSHFDNLLQMKKRIEELSHEVHDNPEDTTLQEKYGELLHQFEAEDGYNINLKVEQVLTGLGFTPDQMKQPVSQLSGGEKRRGFLGKILLSQANLILLDEPTNHLDIFSIKWLENFLKEYQGAIFMVSHDKHFINAIVNEILELERGQLEQYTGNYDQYKAQKEERLLALEKAYDLQQTKIEKEEEFIRRNIAGQKTKQAQGRRKALEKVNRIERPLKEKSWHFKITHSVSHHNHIFEVNKFSKSYEDKVILDSISMKLQRKDRMGIVGRNGCGKSTLIKAIISSEDNPSINRNEQIKIGYFAQSNDELDPDLTLFETIFNEHPNFTHQEVRDLLARFQFQGDDIEKQVSNLSGGEKTRISLLKTILSESDVLILDEPTNHLDIQTREILGSALKDFAGTVLVISHDRSFLDQFTDRIYLIANAQGKLFLGNYSENEDKIIQLVKEPAQSEQAKEKKEYNEKPAPKKKNVNVFKVEQIEKEIEELELQKEELANQLLDEKVYSNYEEYNKVDGDLKKVNQLLEDKYEEWESYHG